MDPTASPALEPGASEAEEPAPETDASEESSQEQPFDPAAALAKIRKANQEAKALRERTKGAEKRAETAEEQAKRVPELEAALRREQVARKVGLPDELVDRLRGDTAEEMLADAEKLVSLIGSSVKPPAPPRPVVESLQPGSGEGGSGPKQLTRADLKKMSPEQIIQAQNAGQLKDLIGG